MITLKKKLVSKNNSLCFPISRGLIKEGLLKENIEYEIIIEESSLKADLIKSEVVKTQPKTEQKTTISNKENWEELEEMMENE
jgi:hypothetical protein